MLQSKSFWQASSKVIVYAEAGTELHAMSYSFFIWAFFLCLRVFGNLLFGWWLGVFWGVWGFSYCLVEFRLQSAKYSQMPTCCWLQVHKSGEERGWWRNHSVTTQDVAKSLPPLTSDIWVKLMRSMSAAMQYTFILGDCFLQLIYCFTNTLSHHYSWLMMPFIKGKLLQTFLFDLLWNFSISDHRLLSLLSPPSHLFSEMISEARDNAFTAFEQLLYIWHMMKIRQKSKVIFLIKQVLLH